MPFGPWPSSEAFSCEHICQDSTFQPSVSHYSQMVKPSELVSLNLKEKMLEVQHCHLYNCVVCYA